MEAGNWNGGGGMKLYQIRCRGMTYHTGGQTAHGIAYVVAPDAETAYQTLRKHLNEKNLGFEHERELDEMSMIADSEYYSACPIKLFVHPTTESEEP